LRVARRQNQPFISAIREPLAEMLEALCLCGVAGL
jgi:hypothetical protein